MRGEHTLCDVLYSLCNYAKQCLLLQVLTVIVSRQDKHICRSGQTENAISTCQPVGTRLTRDRMRELAANALVRRPQRSHSPSFAAALSRNKFPSRMYRRTILLD
jgi:hypothetical protein